MSKYIVEIKPEYEDSFKGLMILGAKDSNLFVDTLAVEDLEELNSDYINEHFSELQDTAYKKGLHDGESKCGYCNEYQRGLDDAWECARELYLNGACKDLFGEYFNTFIKNHTAQEAIEKLKAYEEQKADEEIEVGDEVTASGEFKGIVTVADYGNDVFYVLFSDGSCGRKDVDTLKKTGRHFDIEKILEEMKK